MTVTAEKNSFDSSSVQRWINRCWRRLRVGQFLKTAADWVAGYLLVFGTVVLGVKLAGQQLWPAVLWLVAGVVPVMVAAWWASRREAFTREEAIAILDRRLNAGGLLMTLIEQPDAAWEAQLPRFEQMWRASLPQLRPVRFARQVALPLAFAIGVCFVPERQIEASSPLRSTAGQQASDALAEVLEEVKQAELLKEEEQEQLTREVAQLALDTSKAPLTHEKWETVDALRARLQTRIDESSARMTQARRALSALAAAMNGQSDEQLTEEEKQKLVEEAVETLQKLSKNGSLPGASAALNDKLKRLTKNGLPQDDTERQQLINDLKEHLDSEFDKLAEMRSKCKKCGQCQGDKEGQCQADGECEDGRPGRGGISRGRGDAEMTWGKESDLDGIKFKETVLPPGQTDKPRDETTGVSASAPTVDPAATAPRNAARGDAVTSGDETWNRNVRPRHRPVLKKYFSESDKK